MAWIDLKLASNLWVRIDFSDIAGIAADKNVVNVTTKHCGKLMLYPADAADLIHRTGGPIGGENSPTITPT